MFVVGEESGERPTRLRVWRNVTARRPIALLGKADVAGEATGTTCKDFSNEVKAEGGESQSGSIAESPSLIDDDSPINEGPGKGTRPEAS